MRNHQVRRGRSPAPDRTPDRKPDRSGEADAVPALAAVAAATAVRGSRSVPPDAVVVLQRAVGNSAVVALLEPSARPVLVRPVPRAADPAVRAYLSREHAPAAGPPGIVVQRAGDQSVASGGGVSAAVNSPPGRAAALTGLAATAVLLWTGASPWTLLYGAVGSGALAAVAAKIYTQATGTAAGAVPMALSGDRLDRLRVVPIAGFTVSTLDAEMNPDQPTRTALERWRAYARRGRGDRRLAATVTMVGKLLQERKSADDSMIVAYGGNGTLQAVGRCHHAGRTLRVTTIVGDPDRQTRQSGGGRALLMYAASMQDVEGAVPAEITLQAANVDLVPYYEGMGFTRT